MEKDLLKWRNKIKLLLKVTIKADMWPKKKKCSHKKRALKASDIVTISHQSLDARSVSWHQWWTLSLLTMYRLSFQKQSSPSGR